MRHCFRGSAVRIGFKLSTESNTPTERVPCTMLVIRYDKYVSRGHFSFFNQEKNPYYTAQLHVVVQT